MADEEGPDGEPLSVGEMLRQCTVLTGELREPDPEYPVGICEVPFASGEAIRSALICVGEATGRLVVAVPFDAWHRTVARRRLPQSFLSKAVSIEVPFSSARSPEGERMNSRLWIGLLAPSFEECISFDASETPLDLLFDEDEVMLPIAADLVTAVERFFPIRAAAPSSFESIPPEQGGEVHRRVGALENTLADIQSQLSALLAKSDAAARPSVAKAQASRDQRREPAQAVPALPGLDPSVTQAALAAGIPLHHLEAMSKVASQGKPISSQMCPLANQPRRA